MTAKVEAILPHLFYEDGVLYRASKLFGVIPAFTAWEFNGWQQESMSWKTGCYIHAGLSGDRGHLVVKGSDAKRFLESVCINSFSDFPIGSMKHAVACDDDGVIVTHGIVERIGEDEFHGYAGAPPIASTPDESLDVTVERRDLYLFQIAGPRSRDLLEKVLGQDLKDLKFLHFRPGTLGGKNVQVARPTEIARIGMARNLAYELHGPMEDAEEVYDAVYQAGQDFGIERLGWSTYLVNHTEGGFPQATWHFTSPGPAGLRDPSIAITGSVDPANLRARFRTPVEAGWGRSAKFDHDFVGRAAVQHEVENPKRTTVTLRWDPADVADIYASLLEPGENYKPLTMPLSPAKLWPMAHADYIEKDGHQVGYSSGTVYSYYFREFLSLGCIDLDQTNIGNQVTVAWGDHGGRIKKIRAVVAAYPYLSQGQFGQPEPSQPTPHRMLAKWSR